MMTAVQKKATATITKVSVKKVSKKAHKRGSMEAILKAMDNLRKKNVDLSYLKP